MSIDQLQDSPEVGKANTVCCRLTCHVLLRPCCSVLVLDMHLEAVGQHALCWPVLAIAEPRLHL